MPFSFKKLFSRKDSNDAKGHMHIVDNQQRDEWDLAHYTTGQTWERSGSYAVKVDDNTIKRFNSGDELKEYVKENTPERAKKPDESKLGNQ